MVVVVLVNNFFMLSRVVSFVMLLRSCRFVARAFALLVF